MRISTASRAGRLYAYSAMGGAFISPLRPARHMPRRLFMYAHGVRRRERGEASTRTHPRASPLSVDLRSSVLKENYVQL